MTKHFNVLLDIVNKTEKDFVFFFDNVEELNRNPQSTNRRLFVQCIEKILETCPRVKVLLTARGNIGSSTKREICVHLDGLKEDSK